MPCTSYEPDNYSTEITTLRELNNKLSRIACRALAALDDLGPGGNLITDSETINWWEAHKKADLKAMKARDQAKLRAQEKQAAAELLAERKKAALAKLSDEDIIALGVK